MAPSLALSLGEVADLGVFVPGVAGEYETLVTGVVTSSGGDAALSVSDPLSDGRLRNGAFSLTSALQARATNGANPSAAFAPVGAAALTLLSYSGPVSLDTVTIGLKQAVGANEALRTGTYSKTLTFTLSTTAP